MLFGLMYVLNLSYPADLRYMFEVIQKIWMELDATKLSNKALALKNRLSEWTGQNWWLHSFFILEVHFSVTLLFFSNLCHLSYGVHKTVNMRHSEWFYGKMACFVSSSNLRWCSQGYNHWLLFCEHELLPDCGIFGYWVTVKKTKTFINVILHLLLLMHLTVHNFWIYYYCKRLKCFVCGFVSCVLNPLLSSSSLKMMFTDLTCQFVAYLVTGYSKNFQYFDHCCW